MDEYTAFGRAERKRMLMSIARFAHINRPISGYYFEFGCHGANTMRLAWNCFHHLFDWSYVAFDSFQGLPSIGDIDRQEIWREGKLKTTEQDFTRICRGHGIPEDRLTTVPGYYDRSLTDEVKSRLAPGKAAVVYVDCDLYESTVPVLRFVAHFLQPGTVIVFDDWNCFLADPARGERRAFAEFRAANPSFRFEPFYATDMQQAFVFVGDRPAR